MWICIYCKNIVVIKDIVEEQKCPFCKRADSLWDYNRAKKYLIILITNDKLDSAEELLKRMKRLRKLRNLVIKMRRNYNEFNNTWIRWHDYLSIIINEFPIILIRRYDWMNEDKNTLLIQLFGTILYKTVRKNHG